VTSSASGLSHLNHESAAESFDTNLRALVFVVVAYTSELINNKYATSNCIHM
jgi:hypothetical protein